MDIIEKYIEILGFMKINLVIKVNKIYFNQYILNKNNYFNNIFDMYNIYKLRNLKINFI